MNVPKKRVKIVKTTDHVYSWGCICLCIKARPEYVDLQRRWCKHQDDTENLNIIMNFWDNPLSSYKKERGGWGEKDCILGCVCKFEHAQVCPWALNCVALLLDLVVFPVTERSVPLPAPLNNLWHCSAVRTVQGIFPIANLKNPLLPGCSPQHKKDINLLRKSREGWKDDQKAGVLLLWGNAELGLFSLEKRGLRVILCALSVPKWVYEERCRGTFYKSI